MTLEKATKALQWVSQLSTLVPLLVAFRTRPFLWWYAVAGFVADNAALSLRLLDLPYRWTGSCFSIAEFVILSYYYWQRLGKPRWLAILASVVLLGTVAHTVFWEANLNNSPKNAILCMVFLVYAVLDFYHFLQRPHVSYLEQSQGFWVNTAVLFYAATTCVLFLFYKGLLETNPINKYYWACFFFCMNTLRYLLLAVALRAKYP